MNAATPAAARGAARRRGLLALLLIVLIAGAIWGTHWFLYARHFENTDDAYAVSDMVQITSEVAGTVVAVHVDNTQSVQQGQALVDLDPADAELAMASAEASLADAVRKVRGTLALADQYRATIVERKTALARAQADYDRRKSLVEQGAVSAEELAHARDTLASLRASLDATHEQLNATLAQTQGTTIATHPLVLSAASAVRNAALALRRTHLVAPIAGVVAKRTVQIGQRISPGEPLMAVVPLSDMWVDANFKEVQLQNMRVGQPVTLHADLYGSDVVYHGRLAGMAAGSGSAFALLPAQNASGNWIKIVQRVPVRITLDPKEIAEHPLRIGLSMNVSVDVRDTSGPVVATQVRAVPLPVRAGDDADDARIQKRIDEIIRANSGN
ncbi:MAG TPA: HlyD family efflux transporter periplasmic adaptor subunit [Stenotrophobium sp.]|jgi:membrane fusion protein (multidrug efflux system)|nr:HlyD family efflux transporter periplasmic adaptor subunit [Stenotrophobium sp.]